MSPLNEMVTEALAEAETWTFRSSVFPAEPDEPFPNSKAFRVGRVAEKYVERQDLIPSVGALYSETKRGSVTKLVAGTGTGKSTKVPVVMSVTNSCIGLVLFPSHVLAASVAEYVSTEVAVKGYARCTVRCVSSVGELLDVVSPGVAYMGVNEFLSVFSGRPDLFSTVSIEYVILDESHERIPGYMVVRYMLSTRLFGKTRFFFASATASDQSMEKRTEGVTFVTKGLAPADLNYDNPDGISSSSAMHHSAIVSRVMVFVPYVSCFPVLQNYYRQNSVDIRVLYPDATLNKIQSLNGFLLGVTHPVVVLATAAQQSGYTFHIDVSITCGVTGCVTVDPETSAIKVVDRFETSFERVQRLGRAGRHMSGHGYYVKHPPADEDFELYTGSEVYVLMWLKLFNVSASIAFLQPWADVVSRMSLPLIRVLLCSRVHPVFFLNYFAENGKCYNGVQNVMPLLLGGLTRIKPVGERLAEHVIDSWKLVKFAEAQDVGLPVMFRMPCDIPNSWYALAYVMYHGLCGNSVTRLMKSGVVARSLVNGGDDKRSALSIAMDESVLSVSSKLPTVCVETPSHVRRAPSVDLLPSDSSSVRERTSGGRVRTGDVPFYGSTRPGVSSPLRKHVDLNDVAPPVARRDSVVQSTRSRVSSPRISDVSQAFAGLRVGVRDAPGLENVTTDDDSVYTRVDDVDARLKKVRAKDLVSQRIRPRSGHLMAVYRRVREDSRQEELYRDMKACKREIATMSKIDMEMFFVATISTWNRRMSHRRQFASAPSTVPFFGSLINSAEDAKFEKSRDRMRGFLGTFEYHGYKLAIDSSVVQLGVLAMTEELTGARVGAASALSLVSDSVVEAVSLVQRCVQLYRRTAGLVGHFYVDGNVMYIVDHVFEVPEESGWVTYMPRCDVKSMHKSVDTRLTRCALVAPAESVVGVRPAQDTEVVLVVGYCESTRPECYGPFVVRVDDTGTFYSGSLSGGMSGCPLVSVLDGCVVGFHVGISGLSGALHSEFVSI